MPTEQIPDPQIGTDVSFELIPFTIVNGAPVYASGYTLTGQADRANIRNQKRLFEGSGLSHNLEHYTPYKKSWDLQLDAVRWRDENPIEKVAAEYEHAKIIITTPTSVQTYWGAIEEWGQPVEPAKTVETLTLKPVYRGAGNPNPEITFP